LDPGIENTQMDLEQIEQLELDIGSRLERTEGLHARADPLE